MPQRFGQHFLTDRQVLKKIAETACGTHSPRVIEIGPGRGALTRELLPLVDELHAIEIDRNLTPRLEREFGGMPNFHLHIGDVLETDLAAWGPAVVTGNLPYYITSPILERFLRLDEPFPRAVFLVQEEVAERICAGPGSRAYGYLSLQVQLVCRPELVCKVPAGAFSPPPKVESGVVLLSRYATMTDENDRLLQFIGRCFLHKRKTLRNNLKPYYSLDRLDSMPEVSLRAEQLNLEQFKALFARLTAG